MREKKFEICVHPKCQRKATWWGTTIHGSNVLTCDQHKSDFLYEEVWPLEGETIVKHKIVHENCPQCGQDVAILVTFPLKNGEYDNYCPKCETHVVADLEKIPRDIQGK